MKILIKSLNKQQFMLILQYKMFRMTTVCFHKRMAAVSVAECHLYRHCQVCMWTFGQLQPDMHWFFYYVSFGTYISLWVVHCEDFQYFWQNSAKKLLQFVHRWMHILLSDNVLPILHMTVGASFCPWIKLPEVTFPNWTIALWRIYMWTFGAFLLKMAPSVTIDVVIQGVRWGASVFLDK